MAEKFDDIDRYVIKEWLENYLKTKLKQIGMRRKYFSGDNGKCYCILGGKDYFHGIPKSIIDSAVTECIDTQLVIVIKDLEKFEIYLNSIRKLIDNKDRLSYSAMNKQYEFNIIKEKGFLKIKELQNIHYYLDKVGEFLFDEQKRNQAKINFKLYKDFLESVSEEEREKIELEFRNKGFIRSIF